MTSVSLLIGPNLNLSPKIFNQDYLNRYIDYLKSSQLSPASINRKLSSLTSFQKFLIKKNRLPQTSKPLPPLVPIPTSKPKFFQKLTSPLFNYLVGASLLIIASGIGYTLYRQAVDQAKTNFAYTTASTPVYANRFLSFQGRLTDTSGNPISSTTNIQFDLFDTEAPGTGTNLYSSSVGNSQVVTPDDNGIFSVTIGKTHGLEIPNSVFTENPAVFLQITAGGEVMSPRQPIATVAYAINAESLQGMPPSASGLKDTVLVIDHDGNLNLGETSPTIKSTSGTLGIESQ
ncbi:site-specific integrase, partial [Candidatus Shapirobacteria bacterium]|nr:site-specific integrase [Candidatus Shapirobacteria bacterium]